MTFDIFQEVGELVTSVYMLLGSYTDRQLTEEDCEAHTERVFTRLAGKEKDEIDFDQFCKVCSEVSRTLLLPFPTGKITDKSSTKVQFRDILRYVGHLAVFFQSLHCNTSDSDYVFSSYIARNHSKSKNAKT